MRDKWAERHKPSDYIGRIGKIPVRNIWLLYLYASDMANFANRYESDIEDAPDFKHLITRLLCNAVETRMRRNISQGYRRRHEVLSRVRGRIDILQTTSYGLLNQGKVACRYEELTTNTPRNRLVRAALSVLSSWLDDFNLAHRCRRLDAELGLSGVNGIRPSRAEMAADQIARHDADDLLMVSLARLVFDHVLPAENIGTNAMSEVGRDEVMVRRLFEKAVGNFFKLELPDGWHVSQGKRLQWPVSALSPGMKDILPGMQTDIILNHRETKRRIIIDTKFTNVLASLQHGSDSLKSGYIYQIYAYLRSQENWNDTPSMSAEGLMLHPAVGLGIDETAVIQGHPIRFVTIDLSLPSSQIIEKLRAIPLKNYLLRSSKANQPSSKR